MYDVSIYLFDATRKICSIFVSSYCSLDVQNVIANHFDKTRHHTWPKIEDFVLSLNKNSTIYDIGCGNGRNMNIRNDCTFIGCDNNNELLSQAKNKSLTCVFGDNLNLPFNDS